MVEKESTKYGRGLSVNCEQLERSSPSSRREAPISNRGGTTGDPTGDARLGENPGNCIPHNLMKKIKVPQSTKFNLLRQMSNKAVYAMYCVFNISTLFGGLSRLKLKDQLFICN